MKIKLFITISLLTLIGLSGCSLFSGSDKPTYEQSFEAFADCGQYSMPKQKFGQQFWSLTSSTASGQDQMIDNLVDESIVGLLALAVNEDRGNVMAWMDNQNEVYTRLKSQLPMQELGKITSWELLARPEIQTIIGGYVLYDAAHHESINVASVAAHVHNSVMIEKRDQSRIEKLGYKMIYDASKGTLADSWREFKDKCNKNALVLMPAYTSNQRSTAIASRLMVVNLNKVSGKPEMGSNKPIIEEVLMWLDPLSPVFGWEQAVGEDAFVGLVSRSGNVMIPYDWTLNTPLLWANYENRQIGLAKITDPNSINYGDAKHYVTFYMSDGDNVQWMLTGFDNENYFSSPAISKTKMTFGFPIMNLSMISPDQNKYLLDKQNPDASVMESLGGGYHYADNFAELKDRKACLAKMADRVGVHMRQHRNNILALVCDNVTSDAAKEAYKAFIEANNRLIGIVVIQYTPYAGGNGETMWFENTKGENIPVITVRYSVWNYGEGVNGQLEGTPAYIASKYNELASSSSEPTFSATSIHAWSSFSKVEGNDDLVGENAKGDNIHGVVSAEMCMDRLDPSIKVVNAEELIWQLRMQTYPEQTKALLKEYKKL